MWKFGIASIASLCVLTGGVAAPFVMADAPSTAPAGTDKIEGKVVDQNAQPVANVTVNLFPAHQKQAAKPADPTAALPGNSARPLAKQKRTPLATTTTANDGTFSFTGLADGKYMVAVHDKGVGNGRQTVDLSSTNPDDSSVTITLAAPKAKNAQ
ncbi:MAG TPA: hypothetical protein VHY37_13515 [Tepidisphaeraceae bacterium]|jgi:protocatechuate 3,4-dioxygenase beta subunit|nr:hypothetical protein [Tepidisphaeraceae bacterium]